MIRAIFFDIDGTLLVPDTGRIPASAISALRKLRENGIKLFVATGRPKVMVEFLEDYFPFDGFLTLNGQYCFDRSKKILHKKAILKSDILELLEILSKTPFPCLLIEAEKAFMAKNYSEIIDEHFSSMELPIPEIYDVSRLERHEIYQFLSYNPKENVPLLFPLENIEITSAGDFCSDIIPKGGGKQVGIAAVAKHYGINKDEIMVFGDGDNDAAMLAYAGIGVAMGNAQEITKAAADYVTASVWDDGIEKALIHFDLI